MTVVFGKARAIVDDNRVRIPAKFYKLLGDDFLIAPGKGGCILMIPNESYQTVIGSYLEKTQYGESEEQRNLRNGMDSVSLDQQSRLTFSGEMKDMCPGLDGAPEIVFSGGGEFVEMWPAKQFDAKFGKFDVKKFDDMLAGLKAALEKKDN